MIAPRMNELFLKKIMGENFDLSLSLRSGRYRPRISFVTASQAEEKQNGAPPFRISL